MTKKFFLLALALVPALAGNSFAGRLSSRMNGAVMIYHFNPTPDNTNIRNEVTGSTGVGLRPGAFFTMGKRGMGIDTGGAAGSGIEVANDSRINFGASSTFSIVHVAEWRSIPNCYIFSTKDTTDMAGYQLAAFQTQAGDMVFSVRGGANTTQWGTGASATNEFAGGGKILVTIMVYKAQSNVVVDDANDFKFYLDGKRQTVSKLQGSVNTFSTDGSVTPTIGNSGGHLTGPGNKCDCIHYELGIFNGDVLNGSDRNAVALTQYLKGTEPMSTSQKP